jgi:hypothetical protein
MRHPFRSIAVAVGILALASTLLAGQAKAPAAQSSKAPAKAYVPPKLPWGDPDLQGTWTGDDYINVPMQRNAQFGTRATATPEEIAAAEARIKNTEQRNSEEFAAPNSNVTTGPPGHWGESARHPATQTSLIVDPPDGRMPAVKPDPNRKPTGAFNVDRPAGPEAFSYYIRCISRGPAGSILPVVYGNGSQIIQGQGYVAIMQEMVHEARIIPIGGSSPHVGSDMKTYMGDSRGHWEGNTLVVETTNFLSNRTGIGPNGGGTPLSEAAKLTEHFTRISADTIKYDLTVDDPKTYERPFTLSFPIRQEPGYSNFEYACHEGNYAMFNSLSGARADDKKAAAAGQ